MCSVCMQGSMSSRPWQGFVFLRALPISPRLSSHLLQDLLHTSNTAYSGVGKLFCYFVG